MALQSSNVNTDDAATASQYNNLRADLIAHKHDGVDTASLGAGSVGTTQLADASVTAQKIQDGAVTSAKIADGTIVDADISASAAIAQSKISNTVRAIDADMVDGSHASAFATSGHNHDATYVNEGQVDAISTAMVQDSAIISRKVDLTHGTAFVTASETTTSTTYADLATAGPSVTLSPGITQDYLILYYARASNTGPSYSIMAPSIAGAAPSDNDAVLNKTVGDFTLHGHTIASAVASGSTIKLQYRVDGNTGAFSWRRLSAIAI